MGQFKEGKQEGKGTFTWANGATYEGDWKDNQRHGRGVYQWGAGDRYEGDFAENRFNGQGTRFEGFFKQGQKNGPFVESDAQGNVIRKGTYKMGRLAE